MGHFKKIINALVNVLTGVLLLILILVIYGKCVSVFTDNKYPNYFGYTIFEVASGSMEPTLYINDVILIDITKDKLELNDIVAFYNDGAIITHRIIFMDGDLITVKGDNNNTIDVPINRSQIIGKVIKVFPKFGVWKRVLTEPKILVLLFVTLLLFDFALSYKPSKNRVDKKKVDKAVDNQSDDMVLVKENNVKKVRDVIESNELLEMTRKIDINEINELLEKQNIMLNKREKNIVKKEISNDDSKKNDKKEKTVSKNKKSSEYTMRLDLNEIQKKINSKVK